MTKKHHAKMAAMIALMLLGRFFLNANVQAQAPTPTLPLPEVRFHGHLVSGTTFDGYADQIVTLSAVEGAQIHYTTNGQDPRAYNNTFGGWIPQAPQYEGEFPLEAPSWDGNPPQQYTLKVVALRDKQGWAFQESSEILEIQVTLSFGYLLTVVCDPPEGGSNTITIFSPDGNTHIHSEFGSTNFSIGAEPGSAVFIRNETEPGFRLHRWLRNGEYFTNDANLVFNMYGNRTLISKCVLSLTNTSSASIAYLGGKTMDVELTGRTLYGNQWNTLCLPFNLDDFSETPLNGANVYQLTWASHNTTAKKLSLQFESTNTIEAGKPYVVRPYGINITDPIFEGVVISSYPPATLSFGDVSFTANYNPTTLDANTTANLYMDGDGSLHYPYGEDYTLYTLRGHFQVDLGDTGDQIGHYLVLFGVQAVAGDMLPAIFQSNGNWNEAANWNTGTVPSAGDDVLILAQATIPSGYEANAGRVVVENYNAGSSNRITIADGGQLYHSNPGVYATIEKNITPYSNEAGVNDGWHLIGHSFTDNGAVDEMDNLLGNDYDLYYYDEPTHYWMNQKNVANNFTELEAGKGYLYANSQTVTLGLKGTLNVANAMVNVPLSFTDGIPLAGFNLVGNPFAHNVTTFAGTNVADEVYRMNETKDNVVVSEITEANPLKPAEGFFVKATDEEASITFNSRTKALERSLSLSKGHIFLELSQDGKLIDRFIVKNDGTPLEKFMLNENSTRLYATHEEQDYAVVVRGRDAKSCVSTEMPINFKAAKNGTYTLAVNVENMDLDYLHLIDNLTGVDVDLLASSVPELVEGPNMSVTGASTGSATSYTFTAKTTDYASRFRLVFDADVASGASTGSATFAYVSNGEIVIVGDAGTASLQVVDVMGRVIRCTDVARNVSTVGMAPGVYVLRLISGDDVKVQKIVIK